MISALRTGLRCRGMGPLYTGMILEFEAQA